ncbi:short chain dehydrogenase [Vibrio tubiashii]|uniref:Short-chain dehydrogenase n=1 Tax=Vibrio tubiashii ATCC 19109 TaxID=1051646 RepID=F9T3F1_9VIBR|nr:short chain dehydrogenase [Vibrio tubiashii]AIW15922.1 short-chain dehydrogenase [Vibrio tubiashii ATCC 19109]EGU57135.1 short chain dehydrogenase [Vibrio tubiashii ATCC 19109]EIF06010.1 short chain dehydrogenase [Vibrio tubiashii NCIMB 1337 = ATCC 19106]
MKVLVIGASGTIGSEVVEALGEIHEVITAGKGSGDVQIDITASGSIRTALESIGQVDAIICATGDVALNAFTSLSRDDWDVGINSRLMGQVNLTQIASEYLNDNGSITLTSGIIADQPIAYGTSAATLNGAIQHFAKAVSNELPRGIRINVVSPSVVTESLGTYGDYFPGFHSIDAKDVAKSYIRSVLGVESGKTFKAFAGN